MARKERSRRRLFMNQYRFLDQSTVGQPICRPCEIDEWVINPGFSWSAVNARIGYSCNTFNSIFNFVMPASVRLFSVVSSPTVPFDDYVAGRTVMDEKSSSRSD